MPGVQSILRSVTNDSVTEEVVRSVVRGFVAGADVVLESTSAVVLGFVGASGEVSWTGGTV